MRETTVRGWERLQSDGAKRYYQRIETPVKRTESGKDCSHSVGEIIVSGKSLQETTVKGWERLQSAWERLQSQSGRDYSQHGKGCNQCGRDYSQHGKGCNHSVGEIIVRVGKSVVTVWERL